MNEYLIMQLKQGRINKGMKQSDVTMKTGIKNTTLSNYENGVTEPDIDTFLSLCELYELNFVSIMEEAYGIKIPGRDFDIKPSEIEIIKKYRKLDTHGKEIVDFILEKEHEHSMKHRETLEVSPPSTRILSYYHRLASAGTGQILFDTPPTKEIEIPDIPKYRKVGYAIGVDGDSMEPVYHDSDILLVEMTEDVNIGEIGIFYVDGKSYVKKRGKDELISLNPRYSNIATNETTQCMGKVVGKLDV